MAMAAILGLAWLWAVRSGVPLAMLTRDPASAAGGPFYAGWLSQLGGVCWAAASSVGLLSWLLARAHVDLRAWSGMFLAAGLLSGLLLVDDVFMIHDGLLPLLLGVGDRAMVLLLVVCMGTFLLVWRRALLRTPLAALLLSLGLMALAVVADQAAHRGWMTGDAQYLAEDGLKLLAASAWCCWIVLSAHRALAASLRRPPAEPGQAMPHVPGLAIGDRWYTSPATRPFHGVVVPPSTLTWMLSAVLAILLVLGFAGAWLMHHRQPSAGMLVMIERFALDGEGNVPAWFNSALLLLSGVSLLAIGRLSDRYARHWLALGVIFVLLSLDETASFHERTIKPLRQALGVGGVLHFAWVVPAMVLLAALGLIYRRFLLSLPRQVRAGVLMSAAIYLSGAVGLEMLGGWYVERHSLESWGHAVLSAVEEALEMAGLIVLLHTLESYRTDIKRA